MLFLQLVHFLKQVTASSKATTTAASSTITTIIIITTTTIALLHFINNVMATHFIRMITAFFGNTFIN